MSKQNNPEISKILNDPEFQKNLTRLSVQLGTSQVQASLEAESYLQELYTEHDTAIGIGFIEAFQFIVGQGYDKAIDINPLELKALTKLMRTNSIAFVLTHKSYIDLMVLSLVLARHGLPMPYPFAGINLDLFGFGQFMRKNGLIFIRRSFKDNPVYKATLRHFITSLLNRQANFMWALEGTRSRTGKLVWPQMGILKYIMEANQDANTKVKFVPVSIVFDLIPDVAEMTAEGRGKKKTPENLKWMLNYIRQLGKNHLGKISLRIGTPTDVFEDEHFELAVPEAEERILSEGSVSRLAFELVNKINEITPITTVSLVCTALLSKFALTKRGVESNVADLMQLIESHKLDALVDRGRSIGECVQEALNLLTQSNILLQQGERLHTKYTINREKYLQATYYANMSVHHLYHRAFVELALLKIADVPLPERQLTFWTEIMALRDFFKFEFFYSPKDQFTNEIEAELAFMIPDWQHQFFDQAGDVAAFLKKQKLLVAPVILNNYIEAYRVVGQGLQIWDPEIAFEDNKFIDYCLFLGEEMHWLGQIRRVEAVSKPFLQNGIRLVRNLRLIPGQTEARPDKIRDFNALIDHIAKRVNRLQGFTLSRHQDHDKHYKIPIEREIVPGSKTENLTADIFASEQGAHIGAFFDLDRTLVDGFTAKDFVKTRLLSGQFSSQELVSQFAGVISYAAGNGNFAGLASISAKGVQGVPEQVFVDVGEEVYQESLTHAIFPEARALVAAHLAMGHTVAIISAATPYQVEPIARDLCVDIIRCTRMEVEKGVFTGNIIEPVCWGEGKALAGQELAETYGLDLQNSFFYTDSYEDLPLLELVGKPRPVNPDYKLSSLAFKNDWPVLRFTQESHSKVTNILRTGVASTIFLPAILKGVASGIASMSWMDGVEAMFATMGDLGAAAAGMKLVVKGEHHLWSNRPAVFIFNHQSNADFLIAIKLIRKDARAVAKKELQSMPILGQMLAAAGTIFLDRTDRDKSIEAMKPAVDSLKNGTSVIIFPEGTRSYDYTLGEFKKGAFHMAMQAGVPIVPIIIKNAHDVMPRGQNVFNPALVEVIVHDPIHTHDWTKANLNSKIAAVRNLYLEELHQL